MRRWQIWLLTGSSKILAPRLRLYALSLQHLVSNLPKLMHGHNIVFEDVLGRKRYLPPEFFQSWNVSQQDHFLLKVVFSWTWRFWRDLMTLELSSYRKLLVDSKFRTANLDQAVKWVLLSMIVNADKHWSCLTHISVTNLKACLENIRLLQINTTCLMGLRVTYFDKTNGRD